MLSFPLSQIDGKLVVDKDGNMAIEIINPNTGKVHRVSTVCMEPSEKMPILRASRP